jgi:very-short-patch-repair endonuclease
MTEEKVSDPRRRGKAWTTVGHGVRVPSGLSGRPAMLAELEAWQPLLPASAVWTGLTAAEVHGLWMPTVPSGTPLFAAAGRVAGEVVPVRRRLALSRHSSSPVALQVDGVRVAPVADCIVAAARFLPVLDLVVLIDSALQLGRCTWSDLAAAAAERRHGAPATRAALPLTDGRSESAWETLLRLLHVVCGITVEPQVELFDEYGAFIARADLRVSGTRLLQEYDGAQHRDAAEQRKDLRRARRIADIGGVRRGYVAPDLLQHAHVVLRAADEALGRATPTDPGPWLRLVAASLYTPAGRRAFLARVQRTWTHLRTSGTRR